MEGDREQSLLAAAHHLRADVEQGARDPAVLDDPDAPFLLDDVEAAALIARCSDVHRRIEA
jgi:hypothetical protein